MHAVFERFLEEKQARNVDNVTRTERSPVFSALSSQL